MRRGERLWGSVAVIAIIVLLALTPPGRDVGGHFFASLRMAKPQPVSVTIPGFSGPAATRRLEDALGGMVADTVAVTLDVTDRAAPSAAVASELAGFSTRLPRNRSDQPTLVVTGEHAVAMTVNRAQLLTMLREAGRPSVAVPPSVNGARLTITTGKSIRVQYGHWPHTGGEYASGPASGAATTVHRQ